MSITFLAETAVTIRRDDQRLAEIDAAISECYVAITSITTGGAQEYTIMGSRMVKRADIGSIYATIEALEKQRRKYEKRVMMARGFVGRNHADFSGSNTGDDPGDVD